MPGSPAPDASGGPDAGPGTMFHLNFLRMKKFATTLLFLAAAATASAGGLMTNSNQSAAFLRSIARGTSLEADAVYNNPAGVVFMADGFHLGLTNQIAWQTRQTESTFAPFALGVGNNGSETKLFKGTVFSPIIPSFHLAYKKDRWAVMANLGVNGGGGRVKYKNGLASFERLITAMPLLLQQQGIPVTQYATNMQLEGTLITFAFSVGASYKITDWLSASVQLRLGVTSNSYEGYIKDNMIDPRGDQNLLPVGSVLGAQTPIEFQDHILDITQKGTSISPVIALAFHKGPWDASIKYEFKMGTKVKNTAHQDDANSINDEFIQTYNQGFFGHNNKIKSETPALLAVAASRYIGPVKISAEWHYYFDKNATNSFSLNNTVKGNTQEYLFGAEWQINDRWLIGVGYQKTNYDLNANNYSDLNFVTSSYSLGCGVAYQISKLVRLNISTMSTFYNKVTSEGIQTVSSNGANIPLGQYSDIYYRKNSVIGIGLDFKF